MHFAKYHLPVCDKTNPNIIVWKTEHVTIVDQEILRNEIQAAVKAISLDGKNEEDYEEEDADFKDEFDKCYDLQDGVI